MKDLHVAIADTFMQGVFCGIALGSGELVLSHLFYVDDGLFLGDWDERNIQNLICLLRCCL